jgi:F-type H+-transporting ATPase subunit a
MMIITSPLEQFQILPIIPFSIGNFDFSVTNSTVIILIGLFSFCFLLNALINERGSYNLVPNPGKLWLKVFTNLLLDY